jgi:type IV pilus assembly protein PilX
MRRAPNRPRPHAQRGAALIVGLILLLVMTLLAVAGMSGSTLQLVMAGNVQYSQQAFQAAEDGIEQEMEAGGFTSNLDRTETYDFDGGIEAEVHTTYEVSTPVPAGGYSIGAGFQAHHFEIQSTGTAPRGATSVHRQGFYVVGPG